MKPSARTPLIPLHRIEALVQIEPALVLVGLSLGAWLAYKLLLRDVSPERHRNLRADFRTLFIHVVLGSGLFGAFFLLDWNVARHFALARLAPYVGVLALAQGGWLFVKIVRIYAIIGLFLGHMRESVPRVLINTISVVLSLLTFGWLATAVFELQLGPVLATSAAASLVLGLALQEPLGNLFAGIALQLDEPFEIGEWVEIHHGGQRWVGQVQEMTWRATTLVGLADELLSIPNRVIGQAQVVNYTARRLPILRVQVFRVAVGSDLDAVRTALVQVAQRLDCVQQSPPPGAYVAEIDAGMVVVKLVYAIADFGKALAIADQVVPRCIEALSGIGVQPALPRVEVADIQPDSKQAHAAAVRAVG